MSIFMDFINSMYRAGEAEQGALACGGGQSSSIHVVGQYTLLQKGPCVKGTL